MPNAPADHVQRILAALTLTACLWSTPSALAATPAGFAVEGQVQTAAAGPVADGTYFATFRLYAAAADQQPVWVGVVDKLTVKSGHFQHRLGSVVKLDSGLFSSGKAAWLGVQVGNEPEGARVSLQASPFSMRAASANGLACTGCLSMAALKADGDLDLGGGIVKSKNLSAATVLSNLVTAQSLIGNGAGISGATPAPAGCAQGKVVAGVKGDGSLDCQEAAAGSSGLAAATGNLWTTAFAEPSVSTTVPKPIMDNNPIGTVDEILVEDVGLLKKFSVSVGLSSSDLSGVEVILYDPLNASFVLHKNKPGKILNETWPITAQPVAGDLSAWIGKNPKGKWRLRIVDSKFLNNGNDGELKSWSINVLAQSSNKITSTGQFSAAGPFGVQRSAGQPFACTAKVVGAQYFDTKVMRMYYCDGEWRELLVETLCGNGVVNSTENCDDGNVVDGDGCTHLCLKNVCGDGIVWPGKEQCDDGNKDDADSCSNACVAKFKLVTFTTCGASGRLGPNQNQCNSAYGAGNDLSGKVTVSNGLQAWQVPYNGSFRIEAWGAKGGSAPGQAGGNGARMRGDFTLTAGDTLWILVGQQGTGSQSSGGGGGSFVGIGNSYQQAKAVIVAGGGGGGRSSSYAGPGKPGNTTTSGTAGKYAGGTNGHGGKRMNGPSGGFAGGGFLSDGQQGGAVGTSGLAFINGGAGGKRQDNGANSCADGGFGGGGGGMHNSNQGSGGGGGYSGGGAGHDNGGPGWGGGGGSFNSGANQSNSEGANAGHGKITIGPG